jgi:hypothetical protein
MNMSNTKNKGSKKMRGTMHTVTGNTFPVKDYLKKAGFTWNASQNSWFGFSAELDNFKNIYSALDKETQKVFSLECSWSRWEYNQESNAYDIVFTR